MIVVVVFILGCLVFAFALSLCMSAKIGDEQYEQARQKRRLEAQSKQEAFARKHKENP